METIFEDDQEDLGTKIIFLQKAIQEDCLAFCESLDRLYYVYKTFEAEETNLELIRSLKAINDLCFNNEVKVGVHGLKSALKHYFGSMGEINPNGFKEKIQSMIKAEIENFLKTPNEIKGMSGAKLLFDQAYNHPNTNWRKKLDLPAAQLKDQKEKKEEPRFIRAHLNAIRRMIINEELSFDDLQKKNEFEFERILLAYFCLEGLSVPLAEGLKFDDDDLIFFMGVNP